MKRKLDPKKLALNTNTIAILTQEQFELVIGGRGGDNVKELGRINSGRRC